MTGAAKDWDQHIRETEELARTEGFRRIRDRILALAAPRPDDVVVDVGAGTGLLAIAIAPYVRKVWAVDISAEMGDYLRVKAASAELDNLEAVSANAVTLPLVDGAATLVVSNYCYHHLSDEDKRQALAEAFRVLAPGGRIVIGDMMFRMQVADRRNRLVITSKVRAMARRGPAGIVRLLKNLIRFLMRRWEQPADGDWWRDALQRTGFERIQMRLLEHEGGIISARRPGDSASRGQHRLTRRRGSAVSTSRYTHSS